MLVQEQKRRPVIIFASFHTNTTKIFGNVTTDVMDNGLPVNTFNHVVGQRIL